MEGIQKKIAVLNDLSGYGRCSLTAAMPVISALKVQCCPVVTAVLSNHAGYPECYMDDYTDRMEAYLEPWRKMGFEMDGIMTGFLRFRQTGVDRGRFYPGFQTGKYAGFGRSDDGRPRTSLQRL